MRTRLMLFLRSAFVVIVISLAPDAADGGPSDLPNNTYHSQASEVRLVFFATDQANHAAGDLQREDFAVVDNEQIIRNFRSFEHTPVLKLDVIVLMDSSESVLPYFRQEATSIRQLLSQWPLNSGNDISVLSFSHLGMHSVCTVDCRTAIGADDIAAAPIGGPTPLYDAIAAAANAFAQRTQPDVWRLIILFSDGDDTISKASFEDAMEPILANGVQIYAVDVSPTRQPSSGSAVLQNIAKDSGGRYFSSGDGATAILHDMIADLHSAQTVTYALPRSGSDFHSIRILPTRNLSLQFRSRRGYYVHSANIP